MSNVVREFQKSFPKRIHSVVHFGCRQKLHKRYKTATTQTVVVQPRYTALATTMPSRPAVENFAQ